MLSLIGIGGFGGDADNFIYQNVADFFANLSAENLALSLAFYISEVGHHLSVILNSIFQ